MCERPNRHGSHHHAGIAVGEEGRSKGGKAKKWFDENQVIGSSVFVALSRFCADVNKLAQSDPPLDARGVARKQRLGKVNEYGAKGHPSTRGKQSFWSVQICLYPSTPPSPPPASFGYGPPPNPIFLLGPPSSSRQAAPPSLDNGRARRSSSFTLPFAHTQTNRAVPSSSSAPHRLDRTHKHARSHRNARTPQGGPQKPRQKREDGFGSNSSSEAGSPHLRRVARAPLARARFQPPAAAAAAPCVLGEEGVERLRW